MRFVGMWGRARPAICLTNKQINKYSNLCSESLHEIVKLLTSGWPLVHLDLGNGDFNRLGLVEEILTRQNGNDTRRNSNRSQT